MEAAVQRHRGRGVAA